MTQKGNIHCQTIDDFVRIGKTNSVQFQNSSYFKEIDGQILEDYNIFRDRYYKKLMSYTEMMTMTDDEFRKYKYRPKVLSAQLYETVDYWYILLIINGMYSCMDFNKRKIRVLTYEGTRFIKNALMKEEIDISENKTQVQDDLNEYEESLK